MAEIRKMSIQGIRAFSPFESKTIKFLKPLTIIVGDNGCGKTTIIECLKIGCTGGLPPNVTNGQVGSSLYPNGSSRSSRIRHSLIRKR